MEEDLKKKLDEELNKYNGDISVIRKRLEVVRANQELFDEKIHESVEQSKTKRQLENNIESVNPESAFADEEREELAQKQEEHQDNIEKTDWSVKVANRVIKNEQEAVDLKLEGMRNQLLKQYEEKQANLRNKVANLKTGKDIEEKRKEALARVESSSNEEFEISKEDTIARLNAHFDAMRNEQKAEFEASQEDLKKENKDNLAILKILRDKERFDGYVLNEYEFEETEQDNSNGKFRTGKPTKEEQEFLDAMNEHRKQETANLQKQHRDYEENKAKGENPGQSNPGQNNPGQSNPGQNNSKSKFRTGTPTPEEQEFLDAMDEHRKKKIAELQKQHKEYELGKEISKNVKKKIQEEDKNKLENIHISTKGVTIKYKKYGREMEREWDISSIKRYMKENKDVSQEDPFVDFALDKYKEIMGDLADKEIEEFSEKYFDRLLNDLSEEHPELKNIVTYDRSKLDYLKPTTAIKFIKNRKMYKQLRYSADLAEEAEVATIIPDTPGKIRNLFSRVLRLGPGKGEEYTAEEAEESNKVYRTPQEKAQYVKAEIVESKKRNQGQKGNTVFVPKVKNIKKLKTEAIDIKPSEQSTQETTQEEEQEVE